MVQYNRVLWNERAVERVVILIGVAAATPTSVGLVRSFGEGPFAGCHRGEDAI
jgi:hypothetical protein